MFSKISRLQNIKKMLNNVAFIFLKSGQIGTIILTKIVIVLKNSKGDKIKTIQDQLSSKHKQFSLLCYNNKTLVCSLIKKENHIFFSIHASGIFN